MNIKTSFLKPIVVLGLLSGASWAQADLQVARVQGDLSGRPEMNGTYWSSAPEVEVSLMAQPMIPPRPEKTTTSGLKVQAVHDGKWIALRLRWKDTEKSEAGRLGQFSDAVAIEFPVKDNKVPPPVFMGGKDQPVHVFHWRAQYQRDQEKGKPEMKDLYPNVNPDMYPLEFKDSGKVGEISQEKREVYSHGRAAGNPQSFPKNGVDEIFAEGFGTSAVIEHTESHARGEWKAGEWTVVMTRALAREGGSMLKVGDSSFIGFAVWQGGHDEVGSRKSVTMTWLPVSVKE